jgi:hypothetical protein
VRSVRSISTKQNLDNLNGKSLNLSMDRQHFHSNWSDKSDARRTKIVNISTIDKSSRFVLAATLNFDFTSDYEKLKKEFINVGEYSKLQDKRRYPQYVLPEEIDDDNLNLKPPKKHLLLKQTYSTMAHLEYLKMYFNKLKRINLFGDNNSGFEMSITRVCADLIKSKKLSCALLRDSTLKSCDDGEKKQIWNLYGSYNPKYVSMLIEILRVYNNYVLTDKKALSRTSMIGKTPRTPTQKIGLVDNPFNVHDILEFSLAKIFLDPYELEKFNS